MIAHWPSHWPSHWPRRTGQGGLAKAHWPRLVGRLACALPGGRRASMAALLEALSGWLLDAMLVLAPLLGPD